MLKKVLACLTVMVFCLGVCGSTLYADGKGCKGDGMEGKFFKQARKILEYNKELGLTDKQMKEVKALKKEVKKDLIKQDADIKTLDVEIQTLVWETPLDLDESNELVGQKYELKKKKAKYLLSAYDKLNKILTKEQLKELNSTF